MSEKKVINANGESKYLGVGQKNIQIESITQNGTTIPAQDYRVCQELGLVKATFRWIGQIEVTFSHINTVQEEK